MSRFHQQTARSGHTHHSPPCPSSSWWHVAAESLDTIDNVKVSNPRAGVFPSLHLVLCLRDGMYLPNLRTPSTTSRIRQQTQGQAYFPHYLVLRLRGGMYLPNLRTPSTTSRFRQQTARSGHTHHSPPCPSSSWWHVAARIF